MDIGLTRQIRSDRFSASIEPVPAGTHAEWTRSEQAKLVQNLFQLSGPTAPRSVAFCGIEHGSGATWISAQTAQALAADRSSSVCLVDANLRSPSLHQWFGIGNLKGFSDLILNQGSIRDYATQVQGKNLWVLTSGFHQINPHSIFAAERLKPLIARLHKEFNHVLIDTPPANLYPDINQLGQAVDGVILVIAANSTRRETAQKCKESLQNAKVPLLGAVLNKRIYPIPEVVYRML